jgi:hypothetical protein
VRSSETADRARTDPVLDHSGQEADPRSTRSGLELHEGRGLEVLILEHLERGLDHGVLPFRITGAVERMAVEKRNEQGSRRAYLLGHHAKQLERNAGDALAFELGADQTDRLVA